MEVKALAEAPEIQVRAVDPDAALVAAARAEPREFLALYDRYFDRVLGYARVRIRDSATCEDVTSQLFTTALAQLGRLRGDGSFAAWLFQIARNAVHDVQRRRPTEPLLGEEPASGPTPEERVLERERAAELHALIRRLRPDEQHLLALRRAPAWDSGQDRPRYLDNPQGDGTVVRLRFAAYQYLPVSEANRAMLSIIAQHPSARVEH